MDTYHGMPPTEDILLGTPDGVLLSPVRRFFCLLVTFDFLFTILLWSVCIILMKGDSSLPDAFENQVIHYTFRYSIFDIVMCSFARFVILLLFYALLSINHWIIVASTTAGTSAFLLTKIFLYQWSGLDNATYIVMLVLASFVISWSESWFLDFKVVPQERQSAIYHSRLNLHGNGVRNVIPWLGQSVSHIARNTSTIVQSYPESIANFYSPLESPVHSDEESSETESMEKKLRRNALGLDLPEVKMWIQQGPLIAYELIEKINSTGWVLEKSSETGDNAFSLKSHRKLFMFSGSLPASANSIVTELVYNFECMPEWNPHVNFCQIVQRLNSSTDITYHVSKEGAGGVVSPRDFVTMRYYKSPTDSLAISTTSTSSINDHIIASVSVKHSAKPKEKKIIRGTNGVGGWILSQSRNDCNQTEYQWLLDVDMQLQAWIPKRVVDSSMLSAGLETIKALRLKLTFNNLNPYEES